MLGKVRALSCDAVVLDLEDSVAPEAKETARSTVCAAVEEHVFGSREIVVRINALSSRWGAADLQAVRGVKPDAILIPKIESAGDIAMVLGAIPVWAMIETPLAVLNIGEIAASGAICLAMGSNDLLAAMRGQRFRDRRNLWVALSQTVVAARAHGLSAIDGTYNEIRDNAGFAESCAQGRAFGFDGKTLVHPGQIAICNRIFGPSQDEIAQARRILDAFAQNPGRGAIVLDGRMVERLHAEEASRILTLADAIERRG
jgi:citrate lyase subunit beta/citryl-CoA lyase